MAVSLFRSGAAPATAGYELNEALGNLIETDGDKNPARTIGLIFADTWEPQPGVFGMMFDPGFGPDEGDSQKTPARQGAAVFVNAIRAARGASDVDRQVMFDVVHELGHVFNLWHTTAQELSFMTPSLQDQPYDAFSRTRISSDTQLRRHVRPMFETCSAREGSPCRGTEA